METIQEAARKMGKGKMKGRPGPHSKIKRGKKKPSVFMAGKMKKKAGAMKGKKDDKYSPSDRKK